MAIGNPLDTSTVCLSDVIGNGKIYTVPMYQRDFSWKRDQWEDLWTDILEIVETESVHYMGAVVFQDMGDKRFSIIDGQQRFCTLTLIVLATINQLKRLISRDIDVDNNKERVLLLEKKFVGDKDPGSLTYSAKLALNENNNSFFQSNLLVFRPPNNVNTLQDSDKLIWQAYNFFIEKVSSHFEEEQNGEVIANFLNRLIAEKLVFIQIIVEDELSAYTVFETLNSRGVGLTVTDLLKNYLFSISTKVDLPHVKEKWNQVIDIIGFDGFSIFLRHYWISTHKLIRQEYLFRAVRNTVKTSSEVIFLLEELVENSLLYNALSNYADSFWRGNREIKKRIRELALFEEQQAYPILMAAYNNLSLSEFEKILRCIIVITFRYTVIARHHSNRKEDVYNRAATKMSSQEVTSIPRILDIVRPLYFSDKDFKNLFASKSISTKRCKKLVRYILFSIENHLAHTDYDFEGNSGTIEHILPENGNEKYLDEFPQSIHESFVYRIGNYTLLEDDKNRECETRSFVEKKKVFQTSQYELSKQVTSNDWTPNTIDLRQEELAKYASSVWRVSQYDD